MSAEDVPSLVDESDHFWPSVTKVAEYVRIDEAERELRAQIEAAYSAGIRITHLDHHIWVIHSRPDLIDLYARLAVEYRLPARMLRKPPPELTGEELRRAYAEAARKIADAELPLLDALLSHNYSVEPEGKRADFLLTLRSLRFGLSELVTHCAVDDGGVPAPHLDRRAAETRFLLSAEFREELERQRIRATTWADAASSPPVRRSGR